MSGSILNSPEHQVGRGRNALPSLRAESVSKEMFAGEHTLVSCAIVDDLPCLERAGKRAMGANRIGDETLF